MVQVSHAVSHASVRTSPDDSSLLLAGMSSVWEPVTADYVKNQVFLKHNDGAGVMKKSSLE